MAYIKTIWKDLPDETTPLNSANLNKIENALAELDSNLADIANNKNVKNSIKSLFDDLINPFVGKVGMVLIGDSITWGSGVTGDAPSDPRTGSYTDPKNNMTSLSWANLLHHYIAKSFFKQTVADGELIVDGTIKYSKTFNISFDNPMIKNVNVEKLAQSGTLLGFRFNLLAGSYSEFDFVGDELKIYYTSTTTSGDYELFVDGVSQGVFTTGGTIAYKQNRIHTFSYGNHKIRIAYASGNQIRLEGLEIAKEFILKNAGCIGRDSADWQPGLINGLYDNALSVYDRHVIIMLGTNDRTINGWAQPNAHDSTIRLIGNIVNQIKLDNENIQIYIATANDVDDELETKAFWMKEVREANAMISKLYNLPFIDNYAATLNYDKATILSDGLHPNNAGHQIIADNMIDKLLVN